MNKFDKFWYTNKYRNAILTALGVGGLALVLIVAISVSVGSKGQGETDVLKLSPNHYKAEDLTISGDEESQGDSGPARTRLTLQEAAAPTGPPPTTSRGRNGRRRDRDRKRDGSTEPEVKIPGQGRIRGTILQSRQGRDYSAFYKVPYAQPPVGKLRFQLPAPPKRWRGTRNGTTPGPQCIQKEKYNPVPTANGSEDCLLLNIYTPRVPGNGEDLKLPVLFYLHGGGPSGNGTRYGAKYFLDEDVVLITVEFRNGILGGFFTGTTDYPGNLGLKDQVFAMKWVQQNIGLFGGDPNNVMVFGNSMGGAFTHAHLFSPMTKGLFHRAIMQSGNYFQGHVPINDPKVLNQLLASEVGCEEHLEIDDDLVDCLRKVDAVDLVLSLSQNLIGMNLAVEPVPENGDTSNVFLSDSLWNLAQKGQMHPVPLIVGDVSEESMSGGYELLLQENTTRMLNEDWNQYLPSLLGIPDDENHTMAMKFYQMYFGDQPIGNETRQGFLHLSSDSFVHSQRTSALFHAEKTQQPTYLYWVTKEPAVSYGKKYKSIFPPPYGVSHADELQYLFLYDGYPEISLDSPWLNISESLIQMWVSFAKTGKPEAPGEEWKPIDVAENGLIWYELGDYFRRTEPVTERMLLWDEYTDKLYNK